MEYKKVTLNLSFLKQDNLARTPYASSMYSLWENLRKGDHRFIRTRDCFINPYFILNKIKNFRNQGKSVLKGILLQFQEIRKSTKRKCWLELLLK